MTLKESVIEKLDEYGIHITHSYDTDEENPAHVIYTEDMMIFIDEKEEDIALSFERTTQPERVAQMTLILRDVANCTYSVMESFTYTESGEILLGEDAESYLENQFIVEVENQFAMSDFLNKAEGIPEC